MGSTAGVMRPALCLAALLALGPAPALALEAAPVVSRIDAAWLAGQLKAAGADVETAVGAPDPVAARTELRGSDGGFVWKVFFYDCADQDAALGCTDYEYVAAAELAPEEAPLVAAWSARQRFARATLDGKAAILRLSLTVEGGVGPSFAGAQHRRWLETAADLARSLAPATQTAATPPAPGAPVATAQPPGPSLVPDPTAEAPQTGGAPDREE
jgi:hypothetical protein